MITTNPPGVFLDTSFLMRFMNRNDALFPQAHAFFRHFLDSGTPIHVSFIALAEYGVYNDISQLPMSAFRLKVFDAADSRLTSVYAKACFQARSQGELSISDRRIIPNDCKLFAQAQNLGCAYFLTKDGESRAMLRSIENVCTVGFRLIDFSQQTVDEMLMRLPLSDLDL